MGDVIRLPNRIRQYVTIAAARKVGRWNVVFVERIDGSECRTVIAEAVNQDWAELIADAVAEYAGVSVVSFRVFS